MSAETLTAKIRHSKGKKATRQLRHEQRIPAVLYGAGQAMMMLNMPEETTRRFIGKLEGSHQLVPLQITDEQGETTEHDVLIQEIQKHPYRQQLIHLDFRRLDVGKAISLKIPIRIVGEEASQGVKEGGIIQMIVREVPVTCLPTNIPEFISVDVSNLKFHESIRVHQIEYPEAVESSTDQDFSVVTIIGRTQAEEVEAGIDAETVAAEPES